MGRLIEEEDLNLQDLIFILLFFFIISQTLIVFKVQKDLIVPPKVDKDPELVINEQEPELITLIIDDKSTVAILAGHERREVLRGFDSKELEVPYQEYCDPAKNKDLFLPTEEAQAYKKVIEEINQMKQDHRFTLPHVGLIADHRARYGTIFQVNIAVQELIKDELIDPSVKWKVYVDKTGGDENIYDQLPEHELTQPAAPEEQ
ncbi:MAG: biopolymer transporter ExbD [Candidatus Alcyoniella australis]|nr:biopolymer transporter ExbD [Candidatus Alcyoniella australis]